MSPLRVLCIHGYQQNGSTFREKTGAFRKLLKKQVELTYLDAPLSVQQICSEGWSQVTQRIKYINAGNAISSQRRTQRIIYFYFRYDCILR